MRWLPVADASTLHAIYCWIKLSKCVQEHSVHRWKCISLLIGNENWNRESKDDSFFQWKQWIYPKARIVSFKLVNNCQYWYLEYPKQNVLIKITYERKLILDDALWPQCGRGENIVHQLLSIPQIGKTKRVSVKFITEIKSNRNF